MKDAVSSIRKQENKGKMSGNIENSDNVRRSQSFDSELQK